MFRAYTPWTYSLFVCVKQEYLGENVAAVPVSEAAESKQFLKGVLLLVQKTLLHFECVYCLKK